MDELIFFLWYRALDLNQATDEFISKCTKEISCTACKMRTGCPIRPIFYLNDKEFEMYLQSAEIVVDDTMKKITDSETAEKYAFSSVEGIRLKRLQELTLYPIYSID